MSDPIIGVVLGTHRRLQYLHEQLKAVREQTVPPALIHVWHDGALPPPKLRIPVVSTNQSLGVWGRFYYACSLEADFICVFDDDTIPGPRWLENCINTFDRHDALVGAAGVCFPQGDRSKRIAYGWRCPSAEAVPVDIAGHCWFLPADWLRHFSREPKPPGIWTAGEDYHLSFIVQKYLGRSTVAAPHPAKNRSLWGSLKGYRYGNDRAALYTKPGEMAKKRRVHEYYRARGWRLLCDGEQTT